MSTVVPAEALKNLAKDLSKQPPRSPRETLAGYVIAARLLDKCRAHLNGTAGHYNFNQVMDKLFFDFTGIDADAFRNFVASGADDAAVAAWITAHSQVQERLEIVKWNNRMRYVTLKELPDPMQLFFEDYIAQNVPKHRPVYVVFDIFDLEEGRL